MKAKFLNMFIFPLIFISLLYFSFYYVYNNFDNNKIPINIDVVRSNVKLEGELEQKIVNTSSFEKIFNSVFPMTMNCLLHGSDCLNSEEILDKIDIEIDNLSNELSVSNDTEYIRSRTFFITKEMYFSNKNILNNSLNLSDFFSSKVATFVVLLLLIDILFMIFVNGFKWLKYNSIMLIIESIFVLLFLYLIKAGFFINVFISTQFMLYFFISELINLTAKITIIYCAFGTISFVLYFFLRDKSKIGS